MWGQTFLCCATGIQALPPQSLCIGPALGLLAFAEIQGPHGPLFNLLNFVYLVKLCSTC